LTALTTNGSHESSCRRDVLLGSPQGPLRTLHHVDALCVPTSTCGFLGVQVEDTGTGGAVHICKGRPLGRNIWRS
ncbi:hypothetical protein BD311DRAFT_768878, partial [Dichomitus squalens]